MGERPDQIESHIRKERSALENNFSELEQKVKSAFDWQTQFAEHPGMGLAIAFLGGAVVAAIIPKGASSDDDQPERTHDYRSDWTPYTNRPAAASDAGSSEGAPSRAYSAYTQVRGQSSEVWDNLRTAALALAATRVGEYIDQVVPGFTEHYKKAASGKLSTPFSSVPTPQDRSYSKPNGGTDYGSHS
jgi:hypothetical protein